MAYLRDLEKTLAGGKDSSEYRKQEKAIEEYVKSHGLFVPSSESPRNSAATSKASEAPESNTEAEVLDSKLEKFSKLVENFYRRGTPSETQLQLLENSRQRYAIPQAKADQLVAKFSYSQNQQKALYDYGLMYRAFLENNGEIEPEEQLQLLDLQEELELTNQQVSTMEANILEELRSAKTK